jgi:thioredoxin reductase (NADPH)
MKQVYDAMIVGGGPAGASCAVWLARLGLRPVLVDAQSALGGLSVNNPFRDDWIAVLPDVTGMQVAAGIAQSVRAADIPVFQAWRAQAARPRADGFDLQIEHASGESQILSGRTLVLASGVRPRTLPDSPAGATFAGVLIGPGAHIAGRDFNGLSVAILGGGDNGFENFAYVRSRGARSVHLYARSVRAQRQFVGRVPAQDLRLGACRVDPHARTVNGRHYDLILVFYGWEPQADFVADLCLERDEQGFIRTDFAGAGTSVSGVYAIGEVAQRMHPCVVTSLADGVVAAKAIQARIEGASER